MLRFILRRLPTCWAILLVVLIAPRTAVSVTTYNWNGPPFPIPISWSSPNWTPVGIPLAGDTANIANIDFADRSVNYDYAGPAVTLASLTVDDAPNLMSPSFFMSANSLSATTEYVGNSAVFPGAVGNGWFWQTGGINTVGSGGLFIGYTGTDFGEYDIQGGTASVAGNVTLGNTSGTATGVLTVSGPGALSATGNILVNPNSSLSVEAGGTVTATNVLVGPSTTTTAIAFVSGSNAKLQALGGGFAIGDAGKGTLSVSAGGKVIGDTAFNIGAGTSAVGQVDINDANSLVQAGWYINVGWNGYATLNVNNGGKALALNAISIGESSTAVGTANVGGIGTGSVMQANWGLLVGNHGRGTLNVKAGGKANIMQYVAIGNYNDGATHGIGDVTISGTNSVLTSGWGVAVGSSGEGSFVANNGASVTVSNGFNIGDASGGIGTATLGGTGTTALFATWGIAVGNYGTGTLNVNSGATATMTGDFSLAVQPGSQGTATINPGGTVSTPYNTIVGGWWSTFGGVGVLNVSGGTMTNGYGTTIWNKPGNILNFSSGTINTPSLNVDGNTADFNWTGGLLNITNTVTFDPTAAPNSTSYAFGPSLTLNSNKSLKVNGNENLGTSAPGSTFNLTLNGATNTVTGGLYVVNGQLNASNGSTLAITNAFNVDATGSNIATATLDGSTMSSGWSINVGFDGHGLLTVQNGATASTQNGLYVGYASAASGTVDVTGTNSSISAVWALNVGVANGNGTLLVEHGGKATSPGPTAIGYNAGSVGSVTVQDANSLIQCSYIDAGRAGQGTLTVAGGGQVTASGDLNIATEATGQGTVNINAGGTITNGNGNSTFVGGWWNAAGGVGVLNVNSGGTLNNSNQLAIWNNAGNQVNLNGGTINTGALNFNGNPSRLNWTTGLLNINNNVTFDASASPTSTSSAFGSSRTLGTGQTLKITGNETLGGAGSFALTVNSGGTNTVTNDLTVVHTGSLAVNTGGMVTSGNVIRIGEHASLMTTATVSGAGANLQSSWLDIADTGKGTLALSAGGVTTVTNRISIGNASTAVGAATVAGSGSTLTALGWMDVGSFGQGTLDINTGGLVNAPVFIGGATGSIGQVTVHDSGSKLQSNRIDVGAQGQGSLSVYDGGLADSTTGSVTIGDTATGVGQVTVGGTNSIVRGSWFNIGDLGQGTLTVNSGGLAAANQAPGFVAWVFGGNTSGQGTLIVNSGGTATATTSMVVGYATGSTGLITLNGSIQAASLQVGRLGTGTINISSGGTFTGGQFSVGTTLGGTGIATLDGPSSSITVTGVPVTNALNLAVGQRGQGTLTITSGSTATAPVVSIGQTAGAVGQITVSSGATLHATTNLGVGTALNPYSNPPVDVGPAGGTGTLTVNAGSSAKADVRLLTGNGGTVDLTGGGTMTVGTVGATPVAGSAVVGAGGTVVGTGTIKGLVVNSGGTVQPGFSPGVLHITGDYQQSAAGSLNMEIGGTTRGTQYDALLATGQASLGGTLQVSLINSFMPALNDSFDILDAGSITGTFSTLNLPSLGGSLAWDTLQLYTIGQLIVGLPGDYNHDDAVNAADYVIWRKSPFRTQAQYDLWRAHFGEPAGSGNQLAGAVPEPTSIVLLLIALSLATTRRPSLKLARTQASFSET